MLSFVPNAQGPNLYPTLHLCTMNHSPPSPTGSTDLTLHHFQQRSRSSTFRVFLKPIMSLSLPAATSTLHTTNKSIYYYLPSPRLFSLFQSKDRPSTSTCYPNTPPKILRYSDTPLRPSRLNLFDPPFTLANKQLPIAVVASNQTNPDLFGNTAPSKPLSSRSTAAMQPCCL